MKAGGGENDGIGFVKNFAFGASAKCSSQLEESTTFTSGSQSRATLVSIPRKKPRMAFMPCTGTNSALPS